MAMIEGFRVQNYGVLKDITLGKLWNQHNVKPLTPLIAVIGKNGVGKSALFDAFGFIADCLSLDVEEACNIKGRGGFDRLVSGGASGPIQFTMYYRQSSKDRPITYELSIAKGKDERPYVESERLRQRRKGERGGEPFPFLDVKEGKGKAWSYGADKMDRVEMTHPKHLMTMVLGLVNSGSMKKYPRITHLRDFIRRWHLSYFTPGAARSLPLEGPQRHLNIYGDNLGNVVQFMEREHKERFQIVLDRIAQKIPGIEKISTHKSQDGRLLIRFYVRGFSDPFYAQQMSDGTLKILAYLLLLEDPDPAPFICIEEPENGLYHKLLETLASEFRSHATGKKGSSQIFVTTHQPYFVDALSPDETWVLEKGEDGFATISRASDDPIVKAMVEEGLPLGSLWYSDYLDAR